MKTKEWRDRECSSLICKNTCVLKCKTAWQFNELSRPRIVAKGSKIWKCLSRIFYQHDEILVFSNESYALEQRSCLAKQLHPPLSFYVCIGKQWLGSLALFSLWKQCKPCPDLFCQITYVFARKVARTAFSQSLVYKEQRWEYDPPSPSQDFHTYTSVANLINFATLLWR